MKKIITSVLVALILAASCIVLFGCAGGTLKVATAKDLLNATFLYTHPKNAGKDIVLQDDLDLTTSGDYFGHNWTGSEIRVLKGGSFDGQGHTITISGDSNGKLGYLADLLFISAENTAFRNVNIVYDLNVKLSTSNGNRRWGGLVGNAKNCTFENCNVTFNYTATLSQWTQSNGFHDYSFGGLVGSAFDCTVTNCKTNVKASVVGDYVGGLVGYASNTKVSYCETEVALSAHDLEESHIGGLIGGVAGSSEVFASSVALNKFEVSGKPQDWRSRTTYTGLFAGSLAGSAKVHDCFVEANNGFEEFFAASGTSGLFKTTVHWGWLAGTVGANASVKNIWIEDVPASEGLKTNEHTESEERKLLVTNFVAKNSSSNFENVYIYSRAAFYHYDVVDENGNEVAGFKTASSFDEIEFGSNVLGATNYWTRGEDNKPVLLPYSA